MRYIITIPISVAVGFVVGSYACRPVAAAFITYLMSMLLFNICSMYGI